MQKLIILKRVSALILMACFFLPISQCTSGLTATKEEIARADANTTSEIKEVPRSEGGYYYPYKAAEPNTLDFWLVFGTFFFSLPFLIIENKIGKNWKRVVLGVTELTACGLSAYVLSFITILFYTPLVAGYFALASLGIYIAIAMIQFTETIVYLIRKRRATNKSGLAGNNTTL